VLFPSTVIVELVNSADFSVDATMYISNEQLIPKALLDSLGQEINRTVSAGDTVQFATDCDDLQAFVLADADLNVIGEIGPDTESEVLRDGDDFNCGDTIRLTFDSDGPINFRVTVEIVQQ
jgi:hypothetical protein